MFSLSILKPKIVAPAVAEGTTLQQALGEMRQLMADENVNHYRMGVLYRYIVDNKLAEKEGFKDARDCFSQKLADLSQSALTMYGAVADAFTEPVAVRFGVTCLYLLLAYKEAADIEFDHAEPGPTPIEVLDANGQVITQTFGACSVDQMRKALQLKRKPASSKPLPPEALAQAEQVSQAVAQRFPKGTGQLVKVLVRNQKGKAVLDFKGIPVELVHQLTEALKQLAPPSA